MITEMVPSKTATDTHTSQDGHDDAADGHDGCGHHEVQHHHVDHLHLLDVIGAAGNKRRCAKTAHVLSGQGINVAEDLAA